MLDRRGSSLVEFAIILPVILLVIIGGLDLGLAMLERIRLEFATEATARCFALGNINCQTPIQAAQYAADVTPGLGISSNNFLVLTSGCGAQVTANFVYNPMFLPSAIPLSAQACYPM